MGKFLEKIKSRKRLVTQLIVTALTNGYLQGFAEGKIFTGKSKALCVPGLNCYSCPGALGSCPIGSLQAVLGDRGKKFSFYVFGFLIVVGAFFGRFVCGWLCPFGMIQDLLYKIPFVKKWKTLPGDKWLKWIKYIILVLFVILLPMLVVDITGLGKPWFCAYICPAGTLEAGIPLVLLDEGLRSIVGWLYAWKLVLLALILFLSVLVYRPFCRYLCPLGAIYGLFNPVSLYRYRIDASKCTHCGICKKQCKFGIDICNKPNSMECIRCGECKTACPHGAISSTGTDLFQKKKGKAQKDGKAQPIKLAGKTSGEKK